MHASRVLLLAALVGCGTGNDHDSFDYQATIIWNVPTLPDLESVSFAGQQIPNGYVYSASFDNYTDATESIQEVAATTGSGTFTFAVFLDGCDGTCVSPSEPCGAAISETEVWELSPAGPGGASPDEGPFSFFASEGNCEWSNGEAQGWTP
jgi:hypothetical protein